MTFTFTDGGSFSKANFITPGDAKVINVQLNNAPVAEDAFSYGSNKLTVPIPHAGTNDPSLQFTVTGYGQGILLMVMASDDMTTPPVE